MDIQQCLLMNAKQYKELLVIRAEATQLENGIHANMKEILRQKSHLQRMHLLLDRQKRPN
jgi:hypothetical protein